MYSTFRTRIRRFIHAICQARRQALSPCEIGGRDIYITLLKRSVRKIE